MLLLKFQKFANRSLSTNHIVYLNSLAQASIHSKNGKFNCRETNKPSSENLKKNNGVLMDGSTPKLSTLFSNKSKNWSGNSGKGLKKEDAVVFKELSPSVIEFSKHLYKKGYFLNDSSLFPEKKFDAACLENVYGRNFLKHAADKFGSDNQEIAKWLPGSDLKRIALFGCPSLSKKAVFSAKTLRTFFKIQENTVCRKCVLKQSCKFANQNVWNSNTKNLHLPAVMNVISVYALESVHPQVIVPDEIKAVVDKLVKLVVKLSEHF